MKFGTLVIRLELSSEILEYKLSLFWSGHFGPDMEKNKTVIEMFYTSEHFRKHWKCGESTCWHPEHMGKCEAVKESQTDWRCFRSFRNYSCSRITRVIYFQFL